MALYCGRSLDLEREALLLVSLSERGVLLRLVPPLDLLLERLGDLLARLGLRLAECRLCLGLLSDLDLLRLDLLRGDLLLLRLGLRLSLYLPAL